MKKILFIALALSLAFGQVCFADVQIDEGQKKGTSAVKFFIARNARVAPISADRLVIWDSTSKDGVSVTTTTTSGDRLVAGITMDAIPGVTSDVTATSDSSFNNWGRVQTWGLHNNVLWTVAGSETAAAGTALCAGGTAGSPGNCNRNETFPTASSSMDSTSVGVALESVTSSSTSVDMMVKLD